ncbi:MAG: NAD-dependent malic enzyme [Myxococcota bacterium]
MGRRISPYFDLKKDAEGREYMEVYLHGIAVLRLVLTNKGTAFTQEERRQLGLEGLLPPQVTTLEQQVERVYRDFRAEPTPIAKYQYLRNLQERQEILFYALLERHLEEMLPIVYTPTVGKAVQEFSALYQNPRGISITPDNVDRAQEVMSNYPMEDVRMIVATDSSAILGIGDQGYGGLAIPIGKLALYTVAGGVSPFHSMPVALDVGTERADLINDPGYLGVKQRRLTGEAYYEFIDKFVDSVHERWPDAIIQWEDLAKEAAFAVLERFRDRIPSFNDDIQGTGAVALAGVMGACRLRVADLTDQVFVIHGAGAGGIGVAWAIQKGLEREGLSPEEALSRILVLDSKGLLMRDRPMERYKKPFAQPPERVDGWEFEGSAPGLLETVRNAQASVLIGLSGRTGAFDEPICKAMADNVERPIVFPLSNPNDSAEAQPADVIRWTDGTAIVATGSPFGPVEFGSVTIPVGQGNNAFIFPGLGFGAILSRATRITDEMVLEAAYALADYTAEHHLPHGLVYPPVDDLQEASVHVTARVIKRAIEDGVHRMETIPENLEIHVRERFWRARYIPFVNRSG